MLNDDRDPLQEAPSPMLRRASRALALLLVTLPLASCGSTFGLNRVPVPDKPTEFTLSDFRTSDLTDASGFDMISGGSVRTDQTSQWDFLYYVLQDGTAQFRPRAMVLGQGSAAGLQHVQESFDGLRNAPADGYKTDSPTVIAEGDVLAGVSRTDPAYGIQCRHFFKLEIETIDSTAGTVTFKVLANPNCEQQILVPGQGGS